MITDWHHKACRVMTNGDREGGIFLSNPHTNNGFFFLLTTKYLILYWKNMKNLKGFQKISITMMSTFQHYNDVTDQDAASVRLLVFLSFPWVGMSM